MDAGIAIRTLIQESDRYYIELATMVGLVAYRELGTTDYLDEIGHALVDRDIPRFMAAAGDSAENVAKWWRIQEANVGNEEQPKATGQDREALMISTQALAD